MHGGSDAMHPFLLRLATVADAPAVHVIYAPIVRETPISFELDPPDVDEMAIRIRQTLERFPWIVATDVSGAAAADVAAADATAVAPGEPALGYAYATPHRARPAYRWSVEVSVYVAPAAWRRGVGRRLYRSLFALLRAQNHQVAYAGITLPNPGSVGLHEALGFERIGVYPRAGFKLGAWHDVLWMRHELAPARSDPPEPIALSDLEPGVIRDALR